MGPNVTPSAITYNTSSYVLKIGSYANFLTQLCKLEIGQCLRQMLILAGSLALWLRISKYCTKHKNNVIEKNSTVVDREPDSQQRYELLSSVYD
jgi:hypothetical protein